ncbi:aspartyl/asparaginyl beta-hydroxylase domain-containing protein [Muriicola sp. Z0-33]|nr:aspartyl/asparaginyl beta-hydroxylase domain-containing protein [Muriicola sp. Z0-33]
MPYLKLPFQFNQERLLNDLSIIAENKWIPHFNTAGYNGEWKVIPLYSQNGRDNDIFALPVENPVIQETAILKACDYMQEVINSFKVPILSARILRLGKGAKIKPHKDHELGYENNNFRLHIPISTNDKVQFILDGVNIVMRPGECWYTNVNYEHSVANEGKTDRVHLVIDGGRNEWSDKLFFSLAPKERFRTAPKEIEDPETLRKIIDQLTLSNEPAAQSLIEQLQQKLNQTAP